MALRLTSRFLSYWAYPNTLTALVLIFCGGVGCIRSAAYIEDTNNTTTAPISPTITEPMHAAEIVLALGVLLTISNSFVGNFKPVRPAALAQTDSD